MEQHNISVVIPTHAYPGRMDNLLMTLSSFGQQSATQRIHEIIIVDNGVSLPTEKDYNQLTRSHDNITIVPEVRIGLNHARNTGVTHATGDIIAFIDDDCFVQPTWARAVAAGHRHQGILCVGGPVSIIEPVAYPAWFSNYFLRFFTPPSFPSSACVIEKPYFLIGGNMSFKRSVFATYGMFDLALDRKGRNLLSGGDIEFIGRIPQQYVWFEPEACVKEVMKAYRLTRLFCMRRLAWQGISDALIARRLGQAALYDIDELLISRKYVSLVLSMFKRRAWFEVICSVIRMTTFHMSRWFV